MHSLVQKCVQVLSFSAFQYFWAVAGSLQPQPQHPHREDQRQSDDLEAILFLMESGKSSSLLSWYGVKLRNGLYEFVILLAFHFQCGLHLLVV